MAKQTKTNAMRMLESAGLPFRCHDYGGEKLDAVTVAHVLGQDPAAVFKTLVAKGRSGAPYVFILPGEGTLNLKKAARATGEKSVEMLPQKDLLPLTGYMAGGCSPIGMKKLLPTFLDETALLQDTIFVSAGRIGSQLELKPEDLIAAVSLTTADLCD